MIMDLKPCLFCGSAATMVARRINDAAPEFGVGCGRSNCINFMPTAFFEREREAVAAWNQKWEPAGAIENA